jgi:RNA polymerase sigma factor (sigma-70 family)
MAPSPSVIQSDQRNLELMQQGDEQALVTLYRANAQMVVSFITRNSGTADDAKELLHEAVVILWERVRSGRFERSAQLSTFLFAVARNLWFRRLARMKREIPTEIDPEVTADDTPSTLDDLVETEQTERIRLAMKRIGEPCHTLLLLFYWEELSTEQIAQRMGFANADTVKSKKYQCKKMLERILTER